MQKAFNKFTYTAAIILVAMLLILYFTLGSGVRYARAAASTSIQAAYEKINVLDDLQSAIIGGKAFDLSDYPADENAEPQVISFNEFCYGYSGQSDYALYVYVYNPSALSFNTTNGLNKIQFTAGSGEADKYALEELNHSTGKDHEKLFYKFKVVPRDDQREALLAGLDPAERVYEVTGIELSTGGSAIEYNVVQKYIYKGFAKGYGADAEAESTLSCTVDGLEKFIHIDDLHFTSFCPDYSNGTSRYTHDCLTSVYFAIPNNITDEYGIMSRIRGEYLKALTSDIFVTGDATYYKRFYEKVGQDLGRIQTTAGIVSDDFPYVIRAEKRKLGEFEISDWTYRYPSTYHYPDSTNRNVLNYVLYAKNGNAAQYTVSSSELKKYMQDYTKRFGGELVGGKYSRDLFEQVESDYTKFDLTPEDKTQGLISQQIYQKWWDKFLATTSTGKSQYYDGKEAIHAVTDEDFIFNLGSDTANEKATCDNLYIGYSDYAEFKAFYDANKDDSTVYLIRFVVDDYVSSEATSAQGMTVNAMGLLITNMYTENKNCYIAQENVYLNFDVIDFNFTKNKVTTVIPCIMSPVDLIPSITPPPEMSATSDFWVFALSATLVLIGVIVVSQIVKRRKDKEKE